MYASEHPRDCVSDSSFSTLLPHQRRRQEFASMLLGTKCKQQPAVAAQNRFIFKNHSPVHWALPSINKVNLYKKEHIDLHNRIHNIIQLQKNG